MKLRTHQKAAVAAFYMRMRLHRPRRSLLKRYRKSLYPRARRLGPTFPANMPSRPDLGKFSSKMYWET